MTSRFFVIYSSAYAADIGPHVFRTEKYALVMRKITQVLHLNPEMILEPIPASEEDLLQALDPSYYDDLVESRQTWRTISSELPISREIINATFLCAGGTVIGACEALERKEICFHVGGGWHHAFRDHAEGFCYVNDVAVAILAAKREGRLRKALVVDLDLHQGNGTAVYFQNDPDVFTFSMHQQHLYPAKQKSDLDIGLKDNTDDDTYLQLLKTAVPRIYDEHQPDLIFYVTGADPFSGDQLGSLSLSKEGLRLRDKHVLDEAAARGIPVVITLAGGYAIDLKDTVNIHVNTAMMAMEASKRYLNAVVSR